MRPRVVLRFNAGMMMALGIVLLVPLAISLLYGDGSWESFLFPAVGISLVGGVGFWATREPASKPIQEPTSPKDVLFSVTTAWILAAMLGGIPYLIEGTFVNPINSTFEAMSGFTTTGATLLPDIEAPSPSILFWRSFTQWLGGIGIVVLFVAVAPVLGFGVARLLSAEVSGVQQPRLTPRIADTAKVLATIYLSLSVAEVIALLLAGMNLYDAVVHTFTTVATGGFNPKNASVGFYDSVAIEIVIIVFMILGGTSFAFYYLLYNQRTLRVLRDPEFLAYIGLLVSAVLFVTGILIFQGHYGHGPGDWWQAFRYAAFDTVSIMTTTGYITADFDEWDNAARLTLFLLMFVGGCAGSTAGGIKVVRVIVVFKTILGDLVRNIHPQAVTPLSVGDRILAERTRVTIMGLVLAWLSVFAVATFLVSIQPSLSLPTSASAVAATLNVIGPGLGQVGASENYTAVNYFGRIILMLCMLLGRLEILTVLVIFSPEFWRRR